MHRVNQVNYPSVEDAVRCRGTSRETSEANPRVVSGVVQLECPCCLSAVVLRFQDQEPGTAPEERLVGQSLRRLA
jgi:hypothetical protein